MTNGNKILLGDLHFGIKRFSIDVMRHQIELFTKQIFPHMEKNNITEIFQLGDFMDCRTTVDVIFLETLKREFFDVLVEKNIVIYTLLGNHDIAHRESRDISLVETLSQLYPDNFVLIKTRMTFNIFGKSIYVVPWIVKGESLTLEELKDKDIVLGHLEIRNFEVVKGHKDTDSELTSGFFEAANVEIYSGHYHLKNLTRTVKYLGTPFQLGWNDFCEEKGFYEWSADGLEFFENTSSKKFLKIIYNDNNPMGNIEIQGMFKESYFTDDREDEVFSLISNNEIKVVINHSEAEHHEEMLGQLKDLNIQATVQDNQEVIKIIGEEYDLENLSSRELILRTVKDNNDTLTPLLLDILAEIDSQFKGVE